MPSLYDQLTPGTTPATAGTPGYVQNIVNTSANAIRPQFQQALTAARQHLANQGLSRGGLEQYEGDQLQQGMNGNLAQIAGGAATHGADLANAQANTLQEQGWQQANIDKALRERQREFDQGETNKENAQWADLIGNTAGTIIKAVV